MISHRVLYSEHAIFASHLFPLTFYLRYCLSASPLTLSTSVYSRFWYVPLRSPIPPPSFVAHYLQDTSTIPASCLASPHKPRHRRFPALLTYGLDLLHNIRTHIKRGRKSAEASSQERKDGRDDDYACGRDTNTNERAEGTTPGCSSRSGPSSGC